MAYPTLKGNILIENKNKKGEFTSLYTSGSGDAELDFASFGKHESTEPGYIAMFYGAAIPKGWVICNGSNGTLDLRSMFIQGTTSKSSVGQKGGSNNTSVLYHTHTIKFSGSGGLDHNHPGSSYTLPSSNEGAHAHNAYKEHAGTTSKKPGCGWFDKDTKMPPAFYNWDRFIGVKSGNTTYRSDIVAKGKHTHTMVAGSNTSTTAGSHTHSIVIGSSGTSGTNKNMPPYQTLVYIQKT